MGGGGPLGVTGATHIAGLGGRRRAGLTGQPVFFILIAMIIVSWVAPGSRHPAIELIWQISEPVMAPFRSILPNMGGIDFSPILLFIGINVVQIGLRHLAMTLGLPTGLVFGL